MAEINYGLDLRGLMKGQCPRCLELPAVGWWRGIKTVRPAGYHRMEECATPGCGNVCCDRCSVEDTKGLRCNACVDRMLRTIFADGDVVEVLS